MLGHHLRRIVRNQEAGFPTDFFARYVGDSISAENGIGSISANIAVASPAAITNGRFKTNPTSSTCCGGFGNLYRPEVLFNGASFSFACKSRCHNPLGSVLFGYELAATTKRGLFLFNYATAVQVALYNATSKSWYVLAANTVGKESAIIVTYNASNSLLTVFVDGVKLGSTTWVFAGNVTTSKYGIGCQYDDRYDAGLNGVEAWDIRYYNYTLTDEQAEKWLVTTPI
jgi:hypothetical protein